MLLVCTCIVISPLRLNVPKFRWIIEVLQVQSYHGKSMVPAAILEGNSLYLPSIVTMVFAEKKQQQHKTSIATVTNFRVDAVKWIVLDT